MKFPNYFLWSALQAARWPRRKHIFGRMGVSGDACSVIWPTMTQASIGIGLARPVLACQILTHLCGNRDWTSETSDEFLNSLDPYKATQLSPATAPWVSILREELQYFDTHKFISIDHLFRDDARLVQSLRCCEGLAYGLLHPGDAASALERTRSEHLATLSLARRAGLAIPAETPWPDEKAYFAWLAEIVESFEARYGKLPVSNPSLIATDVMRTRLQ